MSQEGPEVIEPFKADSQKPLPKMAPRTEALAFSCQLMLHQLPPSCLLPRQQPFPWPRVTFWQVCVPFPIYKAGTQVLRSLTGTVTKGLKNHCLPGWDRSVVGCLPGIAEVLGSVPSKRRVGRQERKMTYCLPKHFSNFIILYLFDLIVFFSFLQGEYVRSKTAPDFISF